MYIDPNFKMKKPFREIIIAGVRIWVFQPRPHQSEENRMYVSPNYKTKKALKEAVAAGKEISVFQSGIGPPGPENGKVRVEGPHSPQPHTWYSEVTIKDGKITKVT